jgi:hypothetical protein
MLFGMHHCMFGKCTNLVKSNRLEKSEKFINLIWPAGHPLNVCLVHSHLGQIKKSGLLEGRVSLARVIRIYTGLSKIIDPPLSLDFLYENELLHQM